MTRRIRYLLFAPSVLLLFALFAWAMHDLVPFGHYRGPYGDVINRTVVYERHATDAITAVNFDFRGFDTLGEEAILFMSVVGVGLVLRKRDDEESKEDAKGGGDEHEERRAPDPSDAVRTIALGLVGPMVVFGLYLVCTGQLTPGGGFQGGVVLATCPLMVYLAGDLHTFKAITSHTLVEVAEAAGIAGFIATGLLGMAAGISFLQNVLPLGKTGDFFSAGTLMPLNICTGMAVAGGFVSLIYSFLEQTIEMRMQGDKQE